jgi:hypothetical protein
MLLGAELANALLELGEMYESLGQFDIAIEHRENSLVHLRNVLGDRHHLVAVR